MPIYAYKCAECGADTEVLQRVSDAPLKDCPQCGRPTLVKQVTAAGFQLKGSGWYVTDFKTKPASAKADGKVKTEAAAGEGKTETKADAKTETKSESVEAVSPTPTPPPASGGSSS